MLSERALAIWRTLQSFPHTSMWYCESHRTNAVSTQYPFIIQQLYRSITIEKGSNIHFQMLISSSRNRLPLAGAKPRTGCLLCWAWLLWCSARGTAAGTPDWQGDEESGFSPSAGRRQCCFSLVCPLRDKKWGKSTFMVSCISHSHISALPSTLLTSTYLSTSCGYGISLTFATDSYISR